MTQGGARLRSGPPPDPQALSRQRKDDKAWSTLPARWDGEVPEWPLSEASARELDLWVTFWRKPQGALWARNGQAFEVALHVRTFAEAEQPGASTASRTLVRQQADALLLTIPAMLMARIRIAQDEVQDRRGERQPETPARSSSRARLKAAGGATA